ncbi:MAG: 16S rRNA (cytosine(967)-C(5))-methyltransferase RsmB [Acidobacteriota bacterium]
MNISPARIAAFDILRRIEVERAYSSALLSEYEQTLSAKDRSLCHRLTLGVLRGQMYLDRQIDHFAGGKRLDVEVRIALRVGLYQLFELDKIPDHSAVNESVSLVQRAKKSSAKGFVNAILRRALRQPYIASYEDDIERLSIETSHPRWLIEKWIEEFGIDETRMLAAANNEEPKLTFRNTVRGGASLEDSRPSAIVKGAFISDGITPELSEAAVRGAIYFQDEGSQLVGNSVLLPKRGRFLDVCAAPGSKVSQIAMRYTGEEDLLVAGDLNERRAAFLRENCSVQGADRVQVLRYDAEVALPFADESFDVVLVDAPCSGTGTIRHNPEIRYALEPKDFAELSQKQLGILQSASNTVKQGGTLIYSTCSLEREENEAVADKFLASAAGFEKTMLEVPDEIRTVEGYARTLPHRDRIDGFFIAAFRRRSGI